MNSEQFVRHVVEDYGGLYGGEGRLTSLRPVNPANAPDPWEREALLAFEAGVQEASAVVQRDGVPHLRLIRALTAEAGCLKCHEEQGNAAGEVSGGASITVPIASHVAREQRAIRLMLITHGTLWLIGAGAILGVTSRAVHRAGERARAREALREAHDLLRVHVEHTPLGMLEYDLTGRIIQWNPAAERIFGYGADQAVGRNVLDLLVPEDLRPRIQRVWDDLVRGEPAPHVVNENLTKDGRRITCEWFNSSLFDAAGEVRGVAGLVQDITERTQAATERERLIGELRDALAQVKTLSAMLPICAACKKIRDDAGYWRQIETYIGERSEAQFSHGICPDCMHELYGISADAADPEAGGHDPAPPPEV